MNNPITWLAVLTALLTITPVVVADTDSMRTMSKKSGTDPVLTKGVKIVPAGVNRIMELQQQSYACIRP